ncbi:hypothetical protein Tco_0645802 [Tanacetum coccineum]
MIVITSRRMPSWGGGGGTLVVVYGGWIVILSLECGKGFALSRALTYRRGLLIQHICFVFICLIYVLSNLLDLLVIMAVGDSSGSVELISNLDAGRTACTYDAKFGSVKHTQLIRLMQFLMGLNDVYQPITSTILAKDPLPNVKDAFYVVSREESHRGLHPGGFGTNKSQPAAFVGKTNNNINNFNRKSKSEMFNVTLGWIIDSGANQHMTDSTKDMFNVVDISSLMLTVGHCDNRKFS